MDTQGFLTRVLEHVRNEERRVRRLKIVSLYELAPGIAALVDNDGEVSVVFDSDRWAFDHPKPPKGKAGCLCWGPGDLERPLKTFLGRGGYPPAKTLTQVHAYAKSHLSNKEGVAAAWYEQPKDVPLAA